MTVPTQVTSLAFVSATLIFDTIIYDNKMYAFYDTNHVLMESKEAAIDPATLASPDGDDEEDEDEYYEEDEE